MTYANIKLTYRDNELPIYPLMKNLIETLALKYPNWLFEAHSGVKATREDGIRCHYASSFKVIEKRELIGTIGGSNNLFYISNHRIKSNRERGDSMVTKDQKKAIRHVDKWFYRETVAEIMDKQVNLANRKSYATMDSYRSDVEQDFKKLNAPIKQFILSNFDVFIKTLHSNEEVQTAENLPKKIEEACALREIHDKVVAHDGFVITILDTGNYAIQKGMEICVKTSEELDSDMRRKLGMLKLVSVDVGISGVGLRCGDTTFVVI